MPAPAGSPHLPVLFSATALALLSPLELAADETRDEINRAIHAGLPRYDPAAYAKARAEKAARSAPLPGDRPGQTPAGQQAGTAQDIPAPLPEAGPENPRAPAAASSGEKILELPKMTIRSDGRELPIKRLPRIDPPHQPVQDLKGEPWESPTGRDARLVKKHLTRLQQILLGKAAVGAARQAEYQEQKAAQMNKLAAAIEMQAALGMDPKEVKKLRDEYLKLYYSGPR